ncbi:hypothetical protein HDU79_007727 [Rhizoclosmatium sp. JEL0117]|nr:hypothetical protein HDU79_007727 [Rhizoclosmatium sp. JEL0117]
MAATPPTLQPSASEVLLAKKAQPGPFSAIEAKPNAGGSTIATLMLKTGEAFEGVSFGFEGASVAGELVFQTGMVGYPESLTDPSYRGQILVITFPLVGNYGVPSREEVDKTLNNLPLYFESRQIHIAGLIVGQYSDDFAHYLASSSLSVWLKQNKVPALSGIDTRALTKRIRVNGSILSKILFPKTLVGKGEDLDLPEWASHLSNLPWHDPNTRNLVAEVSTKTPIVYEPPKDKRLLRPDGKPYTVLAIDVGMKFNQIRCFTKRGMTVKVVPWDYNILADVANFDGVFISNGPGDPTVVAATIENIRQLQQKKSHPIFGICLGHQIMALASGAQTKKMPFGNRGHNIPCTNLDNGRCYITSQNHGYCVDIPTLQPGWYELFVNANDGSNEGIAHSELPYFSVQFHPESTPGPWDTEFLFDRFIDSVKACRVAGKLVPLVRETKPEAPPRLRPKKVLVLGSGGLSIGQAGEFDYSGSQAIKALKEEGIYTILINPNIATIQTSKGLADKVYFLPVTPDFVRKVIKHEKPDGIYCTFGGQTALNVGVKMKDEFAGLGVTVLGTPIHTIEITEDRELFAQHMEQIGEKCAQSASATTFEEALAAANQIGYPLIVRAAYALGGLGSGFVANEAELRELCGRAFATSPQVLVEKSMKGWKEVEYEVVRDCQDNCITVCNMENFDPLGIHTGDSIVVAPSQTLSDDDYMMLRRTAVNVIRHLGVIGECNIQYALNPHSKEYCIIEVNARLSRSSALASKATGYPLAFVAAKLGLNIPLTEVKNNVTKKTIACFEPSLDYVVVKIPRWDLKKFNRVSTKISSQMKSVGEVMSVGRNFEETFQKAIRNVEYSFTGFSQNKYIENIDEELKNPSDQRVFAIANALHKGYSVDKIHDMTSIDKWFLYKLQNIVNTDKALAKHTAQDLPYSLLRAAKQVGMSDRQIGLAIGTSELAVRKLRVDQGITPFVKQIDTVAAEFPCFTNYLYMTYSAMEHDVEFNDKGIMVLGSGVYRIGSSVEFDWCAVRSIRTLRANKIKTIMINYNPETVSTDYDEADRLYFEQLTLERILDIYELENAEGVIVSMGGQTPNNIALPLHRENVKILGTSPEMIDSAENRYKFSRMCDKIGVDQPLWKELTSIDEAHVFCDKVGYPVLVRPSYVLSGAAMNVVYSPADLKSFLEMAVNVSREYPVVISKFIEEAKEIEMDAVAVGGKLVMHVISEHVENAGVHSGDATLVLPPQDLDPETVRKIEIATAKVANALNATGPLNIQFIAKNNEIKIIECNLRASRSFPFVSKVLGVDLIEMATLAMAGLPFEAYPKYDLPANHVAVKVPQFSFSRLSGADPVLGVEMASTGEVACFGKDKYEAYLKGLLATTFVLPKKNILLSMGSFKEKLEFLPSVRKLHEMGFALFATAGTADFIQEHDIPVKTLLSIDEDEDGKATNEHNLDQHLANDMIDLYINLPSKNRFRRPASYVSRGYKTRRMAVDFAIPLITNIKCAKLFVEALSRGTEFEVSSNDYQTNTKSVTLPGLVNVSNYFPGVLGPKADHTHATNEFAAISRAAVTGGFTTVCNSASGLVKDKLTLALAQNNSRAGGPRCDYTLSVAGVADNAVAAVAAGADCASLQIQIGASSSLNVLELLTHFKSWPSDVPLVAAASGADLASVLYLANLHKRSIHITGVSTKEDISLIALAKEKGDAVSCDVNIHALFLSKKEFPQCSALATPEDVVALWDNLESIDCFSVGSLPYAIWKSAAAADKNVPAPSATAGLDEALPLLLTAVADGKLTIDDIVLRLNTNPRLLFNIPEQIETYIEGCCRDCFRDLRKGTPFAGKTLMGSVNRVVLRGSTIYLDGQFFGEGTGRDISVATKNVLKTPVAQTPANRRGTLLQGIDATSLKSPIRTTAFDGAQLASGGLMQGAAFANVKELATDLEGEDNKNIDYFGSGYIATVPSSLSKLTSQSPFYKKHVVSVSQFNRNDLHVLFGVAQELRTIVDRRGSIPLLAGKVLCSAFYEASTRTSSSFEAAMLRLGGSVVCIDQITSSVAKGESLSDTVRTLASYGDALVIRHPEPGSAKVAAKFSQIPVINAGDGIGEHPTQAFLDAYTIREEMGTINGLTITMVGDLKHGRTVHSLVKLVSQYDVKINLVAPASLSLPAEVKEIARKNGVKCFETTHLEEVMANTDVLYVTRIQKERFTDIAEYERVLGSYVINNKVMRTAKEHMIVMHPLPRVNEIDPEVDFDQRAAYFRQMRYGLIVRMALLLLVLGRSG